MKIYHQLQGDMLGRGCQYFLDHPITPSIPRATALIAKMHTLKADLLSWSGTQVLGRGGYRAGATERRLLAADLREMLVAMAATARSVEPLFPGISEQFRLGRQAESHQKLLSAAQGFLMAVEPVEVKQIFTDRAFAANFDEQLSGKIAALKAATSRKASGLLGQKHGTSGLAALGREITATMRELRALMVNYLRESDPALLEVWKAAARVYRKRTVQTE